MRDPWTRNRTGPGAPHPGCLRGQPLGADLSQADGSQHFRGTKKGDVYFIEAGHERYEIVEAVVFGG